MTPLRHLLARIRWDPVFGRGRFEIAYLDRRQVGLVRIPLDKRDIPASGAFALEAPQEDGSTRMVPFHRVREVRRDGKVIWSRPGRGSGVPRKARPQVSSKRPSSRFLRVRPGRKTRPFIAT